MRDQVRPGAHPHSDRPNWQPAETIEDYFQNIHEGLETFTEKRVAELLGTGRKAVWRSRMMGYIPEGLFERLLSLGIPLSVSELASIGQLYRDVGGDGYERKKIREVERCPHCGEVLRVRLKIRPSTREAIKQWADELEKVGR